MPSHIGIAAVSPPGAALCYETICTEANQRLGPHEHPEISMHAFSFAEHVRLMARGDWAGVGRLMLESARKLSTMGAQFVICPDNTSHQALPFVEVQSPIPWLHIADAVVAEAQLRGSRRVGILGTRYLMEGPVYRERLDAARLSWHIPAPEDRAIVDSMIFDDLVVGRVTDRARLDLSRIIESLRVAHGCDHIILGCTELPLVVTEGVSSLPTLDSTRLLARAAITRATSR